MTITVTTMKYAAALVCIAGAAVGLNLGVLQLTDPPAEVAVEQVELTGSEEAPQEPLQVVVDVPVVVPDGATAGEIVEAEPAIPGTAAETESSGQSSLSSPAPTAAVAGASNTPAAEATGASDTAAPTTSNVASTTKAQPATTAPSTTKAQSSTTNAPVATSPQVSTEYLYYDFSGVASQIVIAQHPDGSIEFWSVTTEPGWSYAVESDSSREVEIEFRRSGGDDDEDEHEDEAEFKAKVEDGRIKISKER